MGENRNAYRILEGKRKEKNKAETWMSEKYSHRSQRKRKADWVYLAEKGDNCENL
jgi:hypothetical protein